MTNRKSMRVGIAVAAALLGLTRGTEAGVITSVASTSLPGFSTGTLGPVGATPAPNNDNAAAASPNLIGYSIFFNTFGSAEFEFVVDASGGTTEYRFVTPPPASFIGIVNNTGVAWSGFQFELGFGTGASFVRSGAGDALDFDAPDGDPAPTSSVFTTLTPQTDLLSWSGGVVPSVGPVAFAFQVDVPDGLATVNPAGQSRFTVRLTPMAVPEPAAAMLLVAGAAAVLVRRRRG